jgi:hypothetical protein
MFFISDLGGLKPSSSGQELEPIRGKRNLTATKGKLSGI